MSVGINCGIDCQKHWMARSSHGSGCGALASGSAALALVKWPGMATGQPGSVAGEAKNLFGSTKWCCSPQAKMELELILYSSHPDSENGSLGRWDVLLCQASARLSFRKK